MQHSYALQEANVVLSTLFLGWSPFPAALPEASLVPLNPQQPLPVPPPR